MKHLIKALVLICTMGALSTAQAHPKYRASAEQWSCSMEGEISGIGISIFFGGQMLGGKGEINCISNYGEVRHVPVKMTLVSGGWGFDITYVKSLKVMAVGINTAPENLSGSFSVGATAGVTLINQGISFDSAIKLSRKGLGFELALTGREAIGLGVRLHGMAFSIEPLPN